MRKLLFLVFVALCLSLSGAVKITLDSILAGTYRASGFSGTWTSDTEIQFGEDGHTKSFDVITKQSKTVINGTKFPTADYPGRTLTPSADGLHILVTHSRKSIWRHSFLAKYELYNIGADTFTALVPPGATDQPELQLVRWSPVGNALVFVYENDIYYRTNANSATVPRRVTTDGTNLISNGHTDWVYEEEMFGSGSALWFSPSGTHLAFVRFDDTLVPDFEYPMYGEPGVKETVYPKWTHIRYPKAGQTNPIATVHLANLTSPTLESWRLIYDDEGAPDILHYVSTASWRSSSELIVVHMNRRQQLAGWYECGTTNAEESRCARIWAEGELEGWIDSNSMRFSRDGSTILTLSSSTVGGSYRHIVKITSAGGEHINPNLTVNGVAVPLHIDAILSWDEGNDKIYFSGNTASNPSERQVFTTSLNGATVDCITCSIRNGNNEVCQANSASFSTGFTYFLHTCSGPGIPEIAIRKTESRAQLEHVWVNNAPLREALRTVEVPTSREYFNIPLADNSVGRARLYLPPSFDNNKKYPLLIDVYGGPDSQNIGYNFGFNWGSSLTSDKEVIYGYIDGRGSGRQTREHLFKLNNKLGTVEIQDQIEAARWLIQNTGFIDPARTAIWGWSYGGYATAMVMSNDTAGVFKCGISVAPVTSWLYYDTIYTERYMGLPTPTDNGPSYESSDVNTHVANFRNKQFLLVHGNADDNVHYQQSMILSRALEKDDIMFNQLSYPDEAHGINGPGMNRHLYHSLERFLFRDCFPEVRPTEAPTAPTQSTTPSFATSTRPNNLAGALLALVSVLLIFVH